VKKYEITLVAFESSWSSCHCNTTEEFVLESRSNFALLQYMFSFPFYFHPVFMILRPSTI